MKVKDQKTCEENLPDWKKQLERLRREREAFKNEKTTPEDWQLLHDAAAAIRNARK